jgi:hypothetical protein
MSGKHAETIPKIIEVGGGFPSARRNSAKPLQQLTLAVVKSKFLDSGFRRSN